MAIIDNLGGMGASEKEQLQAIYDRIVINPQTDLAYKFSIAVYPTTSNGHDYELEYYVFNKKQCILNLSNLGGSYNGKYVSISLVAVDYEENETSLLELTGNQTNYVSRTISIPENTEKLLIKSSCSATTGVMKGSLVLK